MHHTNAEAGGHPPLKKNQVQPMFSLKEGKFVFFARNYYMNVVFIPEL